MIKLIRRLAKETNRRTQKQQTKALGVSKSALSRYLNGAIPPEATLLDMLQQAQVPDQERVVYLQVRRQAADVARETGPVPQSTTSASSTSDPSQLGPQPVPPVSLRQRGSPEGSARARSASSGWPRLRQWRFAGAGALGVIALDVVVGVMSYGDDVPDPGGSPSSATDVLTPATVGR
ncbi:MAG: helix-turn-helix domain-containing protein [Pseudonocardiaceae bacterium]